MITMITTIPQSGDNRPGGFAPVCDNSRDDGGCVFVKSDTQQRRRVGVVGDKAAISFYCALVKV